MTEIVSNTATANIVLPILAQMAETIHVNPLYLMIPAAATYVSAFKKNKDFSLLIQFIKQMLLYFCVACWNSRKRHRLQQRQDETFGHGTQIF